MVSKMNREKSIYFQTSKPFQACLECRILHYIFQNCQRGMHLNTP